MDPKQVKKEILKAIMEGEFEDALDLLSDLLEWLRRGGFSPGKFPMMLKSEKDIPECIWSLIQEVNDACPLEAKQHLSATSDRNGNPQRLWIKYKMNTGEMLEVVDEGYSGDPWPAHKYPEMVELPGFNIPVKEYKSTLAYARGKKILG